MDLNKKQINVSYDFESNKNLQGKTIDRVFLSSDNLIITFDDNSFVCLYNKARKEHCIGNKDVSNQNIFENANYIIDENEIKFTTDWIQKLIDLDIWRFNKKEKLKMIDEKREYYEYLRLKEKYENKW